MGSHGTDSVWVDGREGFTRTELAHASGLTDEDLGELIELGALRPLPGTGTQELFGAECMAAVRHAARLRRDFDLDLFAVAMLLEYLARIDALERQVHSLQAQVSLHPAPPHREGPQPWREPHG